MPRNGTGQTEAQYAELRHACTAVVASTKRLGLAMQTAVQQTTKERRSEKRTVVERRVGENV